MANLYKQVASASKWSTIAEISSRAITPVSLILLARVLTPEDYGVVSVATIVVSFTQMISDLGFQNALIQKDYDEKKLSRAASVGFLANMFVAIILYVLIFVLAEPLSLLFGIPESVMVIRIMAIQIILNSLNSIQTGLIQRALNFKILFYIRLTTTLIPALVSIPLAYTGISYWALVAGALFGSLANTVVVWIRSPWKPRLFWKLELFKEMIGFSLFNMAETFALWLAAWADQIVVGAVMTTSALGLYRTSTNLVNVLVNLLLSAILPVLFSTLSRLQSDEAAFRSFFQNANKIICMIAFPLGIGFLFFGETVAAIVFGSKWNGAGDIIRIWGFVSAISLVYGVNGIGYRAKGKPQLNVIVICTNMCILLPAIIISAPYGLLTFVAVRSVVKLLQAPVNFYYGKKYLAISFVQTIQNLRWIFAASGLMAAGYFVYVWLIPYDTMMAQIVGALFCCVFYFIGLIPERTFIRKTINLFLGRNQSAES
ncbi:MAG: lipopolysaccharide biosynthesis protein [Dehalobacter sp. 4CP]|uniref:lipopolysaccharide biosynthesis protein n=1 Tax=Dehalobacter sp. CP TaxID=2594474 RepID=UPI0013CC97A6|nr:lipopolysaccharide biosynthesis protein [Dehalobacter sp. 4CP]